MRIIGLLALSIAALALPAQSFAASDLEVSISSPQSTAVSGGTVDVTINYSNNGTTSVSGVIVTLKPGDLSSVLSASPAFPNPNVFTWNIGPLAAGQGGSLSAEVITGAAPGSTLTLQAEAFGVGDSDTSSIGIPLLTSNASQLSSASYKVKPPGKKGPAGRAQFLEPLNLAFDFDGSDRVTITFSNPTQLLAAFDVEGGKMVRNGKGYRVRYLPNPAPWGGDLSLNITKTGAGIHKVRLTGAHMALPISSSNDIRISIVVGGSPFSTMETFSSKGQPKPNRQQIRFKGERPE